MTFSELFDNAELLARELSNNGIKAGDVVGHAMSNSLDFVISYLALCRLSVTTALVSAKYQKQELDGIVDHIRPACFLADRAVSKKLTDKFESVKSSDLSWNKTFDTLKVLRVEGRNNEVSDSGVKRPDFDSFRERPVLIKFTSGSTGLPKAVGLSVRNVLAEAGNIKETLDLTSSDVILASVPISHSYGFDLGVLAMLRSGARLVLREGFIPRMILRDIKEAGVTIFLGVPSMYRFFLETRLEKMPDFSGIRYFLSCTAPLGTEIINAFEAKFGALICQHYGSSETGAATNHVPEKISGRRESVGRGMKNVTVEIVDEEGNPLPCGTEGEVRISGESVAVGYLMGKPEARDSLKEGFYRTGDIGYLDEEGFLFLVGRVDQLINVGGHKVAPNEVISVLERFPAVREAAVVGAKNKDGEEFVYAVVTLSGAATEGEIFDHCRSQLADYKVPRRIEIVEEMPRGPSGKIRLRAEDIRL